MLKLTTDRHEASRGLFATAELLVAIFTPPPSDTGTVRFSASTCIRSFVIKLVSTTSWNQANRFLNKRKKVKELIVFSEIHLRTMGCHLSMGSHSVICHPTEVTAPLSTQPGRLVQWYSIYRSRKDERLSWFTRPQTVTQTNRVWRSATTLIEVNALPLTQTANLAHLVHGAMVWLWNDQLRASKVKCQGHTQGWR